MPVVVYNLSFYILETPRHNNINYKNNFKRTNIFLKLFEFCLKFLDIDECSITRDICGAEGECQNVPGKFVCKCRDGYESHPLMLTCVGMFIVCYYFDA